MSQFKNIFYQRISKGIHFIPTKWLQIASGQSLILPFYHAISDEKLPHIQHLYPVKNVSSFIQDLDFLLKYYQPIDFFEFKEITSQKKVPKKPSFLLSFDDGLKEFYHVIAPILIQKGIPAVCFVNSAFVDNKALFFRYKASLLIEHIINNPKLQREVQDFFGNDVHFFSNLLAISYSNRDSLDQLAMIIDVQFEDFLKNQKPYLDSIQISSLIEQGFHFGAHSVYHPEYQYISYAEQINQTEESVNFLNQNFSIDYKTFSFPFTDYNVSKRFFDEINAREITDITFGCAGQKKDTAQNHFQRIPFEIQNLNARQILNAELLYFLVKAPFGKNLINRND